MANTIVFVPTISADHTQSILTDTTSYTNPTRSSVGVFLTVHKVDFRGTEAPLTATTNTSDPETDSIWTFQFSLDGHFRYKYVAIPDYSGVVTYTINQAVFDATDNVVYKSKINGNLGNALSDPDSWMVVVNPTTLAENKGKVTESTNIDSYIGNYVIYTQTQDKRDLESINASLEQDLDAERDKSVDRFRLLDIFVEGLKEANTSGKFNQGERIARRAEAV
jgi:hypothetical protein